MENISPAAIGRKRSALPDVARPNAFAVWMKERSLSVEAVAAFLDVSVSAVYGYRRGNRPPSRRMAVRIEKITNGKVEAGSWD